jgi:hypothetical protein
MVMASEGDAGDLGTHAWWRTRYVGGSPDRVRRTPARSGSRQQSMNEIGWGSRGRAARDREQKKYETAIFTNEIKRRCGELVGDPQRKEEPRW